MHDSIDHYSRPRSTPQVGAQSRRAGASLTELIVASGLLVTSVGIFGSTAALTYATRRMEHLHLMASDELSNQMEQLLVMTHVDVKAALPQLQASPRAQSRLSELRLEGDLIDDLYGLRVVLRLSYAPHSNVPLVAVGWLKEQTADQGGQEEVR